MDCNYCSRFVDSKWRIAPDPDESKKKSKTKMRHCNIIQKYIDGNQEICDHFEPHHRFWCDINECFMSVDGCTHRKAKGMDADCEKCRQHKTIMDLQRARKFHLRKLAAIEAADAAAVSKPTLLRRRT